MWLIARQLPMKAGWWDAPLALRYFSRSNKQVQKLKTIYQIKKSTPNIIFFTTNWKQNYGKHKKCYTKLKNIVYQTQKILDQTFKILHQIITFFTKHFFFTKPEESYTNLEKLFTPNGWHFWASVLFSTFCGNLVSLLISNFSYKLAKFLWQSTKNRTGHQ